MDFFGHQTGIGINWEASSSSATPTPVSPEVTAPLPSDCIHVEEYVGNVDFGCCHPIVQVVWCSLYEGHATRTHVDREWDRLTTFSGPEARAGTLASCERCPQRVLKSVNEKTTPS